MFEKFVNFEPCVNACSGLQFEKFSHLILGKILLRKKRENSPENVLITIEQLPHA